MHDAPGAEHWLRLLRDGSPAEQQLARTELGLTLEARGLLDDAAEAYARNVAEGVQDRRPYERLALLARQRGDAETEARTLHALADLLQPPPPPSPPPPPQVVVVREPALPPPPPPPEPEPDLALAAAAGPDTLPQVQPPDLALAAAPADPADEAEGHHAAPDDVPGNAAASVMPATSRADTAATPDPPAEPTSLATEPVGAGLAPPEPTASPEPAAPPDPEASDLDPVPQQPGVARWVLTLIGLAVAAAVVGAALMVPVSRPLNVTPPQTTASPAPVEIQLIGTAPALLPSPSPAAVPSPSLLPPLAAAAPSPTITPAPLAARCADAALRFPETQDSAAAVRDAFREYLARQGVTVDPASTLFAGLADAYAERHAEVLAGWMVVTLQREQRGLPTFPLVDYVASDVVAPSGPGEYQLRATVSPQGWNELRALPATTCEGAFLANPENTRWVELIQASVGDITWALPTPQPRQ